MTNDPQLSRYLNTSCDDLKSSLHHLTDPEFLRRLLDACDEKTKKKLIAARLRQIEGDGGTPSALTIPTGPVLPDKEMGTQLTEQYRRATGGMREVIKFGAMMMLLEDHIRRSNSTMELENGKKLRRGKASKNGGVKAWLKEHAPEVKEATAYRFKSVAESVAQNYPQIVGAKTAKAVGLPALVMAPAADLPEPVRHKQEELFSFVDGTSQKSWLDKFKPPTRKGGANGGAGAAPLDPQNASETIWTPILRDLELEGLHEKSWKHLPDATLAKLKGILVDLNKLVPAK